MATITEDYVSFEVAKLLKEKGFDEETRKYYPIKGDATGRLMDGSEYPHNNSQVQICAPTLQRAMKWLREEHKIYIVISPIRGKGYGAILCDVGDFDDFNYIGETDYFFHPEEAVEAAIKYCLENLIK